MIVERLAEFAGELVALEAANAAAPADAVVFYGSSTIRMWTDLADDFALLRVVNRGFGGSGIDDCRAALARLVLPLRPRAVVLYAGDNDLDRGRTPAEVVADTDAIAAELKQACGAVPLICVGIKPSVARWHLRDAITATNSGLAALCQERPELRYVDLAPRVLGADGTPRPELFLADGLHLSREGYRLLGSAVREALVSAGIAPPHLAPYLDAVAGIRREYHRWFSPALGRDMELLLFGHAGPRVVVFPTRKARFFEYEDRGMVAALRDRLDAGALQLCCIDGNDQQSLYKHDIAPAERIRRHLAYERYILDEVLPFTANRNPHPTVTAHGCSLGAYHAVAIATRHPRIFQRVVAFSGRYDLTLAVGEYYNLFFGHTGDDLFSINPSWFLPGLTDPDQLATLRAMNVTLVVGDEDPFLANNRHLAATLANLRVPHRLITWFGEAHRFRYWRQMVRIYL